MACRPAARKIFKLHCSYFWDVAHCAVSQEANGPEASENSRHHLSTMCGILAIWADFLKRHNRRLGRLGNSVVEAQKLAPVDWACGHGFDLRSNGIADHSPKLRK